MGVWNDLWSIYREALPVLLVAIGGGLFAGLVLEGILERVEWFPGLLVMVPVFLATRGNVTSTGRWAGESRAGFTRG